LTFLEIVLGVDNVIFISILCRASFRGRSKARLDGWDSWQRWACASCFCFPLSGSSG
jgi:hypothetical protein